MFADADTEHPKDSRILEGFTIEEDIDKESLNQYRQRFASIRPDHPWLLLDDKGLLTKLKGYRIDKKSKQEGLTLSGLLMFGKYDSIKDPDCCPAYFPDYREYFSTNPEDRWTDRIYPDGTWEANLFQFYTRVYPRLSAVLPKPFALKNGIRVEDTPTHIALREAFVNTLIHCDYTVDSNITIELHRDRYIFSNPGSLLISIHQYYLGGDSVCRNKSLQQMFMQIGSAETAGSGVNKILQGWKEANFRSPQVEEKINPDKVVLELPLVSLLSTEVIDYLKELFGDKIESIEHDKLLTLATCCSEGEVTNYRLQLVIDKHSTEITRLLKELCNDQYLIAYGVGRGTSYRINEDFGAGIYTNDASNSARPTNSASNDASQIAIKRTRLNTSTLQQLILDVCSNYLSIDEIAERVHKSLHHLKNNIIPKMVSTGLLEREFPNAPKHPNQRYRTKAK